MSRAIDIWKKHHDDPAYAAAFDRFDDLTKAPPQDRLRASLDSLPFPPRAMAFFRASKLVTVRDLVVSNSRGVNFMNDDASLLIAIMIVQLLGFFIGTDAAEIDLLLSPSRRDKVLLSVLDRYRSGKITTRTALDLIHDHFEPGRSAKAQG